MNDHLTEWDLKTPPPPEHPPAEPLPETPRERRPPPARPRRKSRAAQLSLVSLGVSLLALIIALTALALALRNPPEPEPPAEPPEPVTFQFGDLVLEPLAGMPVNPYDREAFALDEKGRVTYTAKGRKTRTGIDVSTHQKEIDWPAVAADGIDFAMLRLGHRGYTEGGLFLDQTFERNLQGALDAGLDVGVYFFSQAVTPQEAQEEADYILEVLNGQKLTCPVAFDWESIPGDEARTDGVTGETLTRCAAAFCKRVQEAGYRPAVYFNQTQGYLRYDLRELTDYELWLAEYGASPDFYYHFDLWQYSQTGRVAGVQGDVDLDLMFE